PGQLARGGRRDVGRVSRRQLRDVVQVLVQSLPLLGAGTFEGVRIMLADHAFAPRLRRAWPPSSRRLLSRSTPDLGRSADETIRSVRPELCPSSLVRPA